MINTRIVLEEKERVLSITCDRCGKCYPAGEWTEIQEFHHIKFTGGYASVFGDESTVEADICQRCLKELIFSFCRIDGERVDK